VEQACNRHDMDLPASRHLRRLSRSLFIGCYRPTVTLLSSKYDYAVLLAACMSVIQTSIFLFIEFRAFLARLSIIAFIFSFFYVCMCFRYCFFLYLSKLVNAANRVTSGKNHGAFVALCNKR